MDHSRSRVESKTSLQNIKSALWILFLIVTGNEQKIVIF